MSSKQQQQIQYGNVLFHIYIIFFEFLSGSFSLTRASCCARRMHDFMLPVDVFWCDKRAHFIFFDDLFWSLCRPKLSDYLLIYPKHTTLTLLRVCCCCCCCVWEMVAGQAKLMCIFFHKLLKLLIKWFRLARYRSSADPNRIKLLCCWLGWESKSEWFLRF